jgi:hypothetical protein
LKSAVDNPILENGGCRRYRTPDRVLSHRSFDICFADGRTQTTVRINDGNGETITKGRSRC